jgi:hypothetical protein
LTHPDFLHSNLERSRREQPSWQLPIKEQCFSFEHPEKPVIAMQYQEDE